MADNYIERQYEAYQAKKSAWEQSHKPAKKKANRPKGLHKRVFITGGASGIGKALVRAFAEQQCQVAFCDTDTTAGNLTAQTTGARFFPVDVCQADALENCMLQLFEAWGDIDILINNVGISHFSPLTETRIEDFDRILATNLRPVFITSRRLALHRNSLSEPNPYGRIINLCSTRYLMSEPGSEGYAASKGGIYSLTHALMASLAEQHITVNAIAPGWIQNTGYESLSTEDHLQHPSGRVGKPEDIARACIFLCQEENDFINGQTITIDGGMTRKMIYIE